MNDGWKFAEELLGVAAEVLKARREAEDKTEPSPGTDRYRDLRRVHHEVCDDFAMRLAAILSPGVVPQEGWNLDRALDAVERLRHWNRETEHKVREAALEEAARRAEGNGRIADEIAAGIRALKSKPAPQPSGNPGELPLITPEQERELAEQRETRSRALVNLPPKDAPVHDFGWALARMREGKKVRCGLFPANAVPLEMKWLTGKDDKVWARNVLATDWEVVE